MNTTDRIDEIIRHIDGVQLSCRLLGERLIESGKADLGRLLIARGYIHDNSKFYGIEWDYLTNGDQEKLKLAISQHNRTNDHHPEFWGGIDLMPPLCIAEMVCDWKVRSSEFGSSLRDWVDGDAAKRYKYTKDSKVYTTINFFVNLLCDKPFKQKVAEGEVH